MRAQRKKYEKPVLRAHGSINRFICGNSTTFDNYDSVTVLEFPNANCTGTMGFLTAPPPLMCV